MSYKSAQAIARVDVRSIAAFIGFAGVATILPFFIHVQWITGPIVNAMLIIVLFIVGIRSAMVLCLVPSLMALSGGLLPAVLAPVVPFIMIGNVIFVLMIDRIFLSVKNESKGYWAAIVSASLVKFLFLYFSVNLITKLLIKQELGIKVAQMMSWSQFASALAGGFLAWAVLKKIGRI
jgi:riboflavin transporter